MYSKILVPLDGSKLAECVLTHVDAIAKGCGTKEVVFVRVVEPFYMPTGGDGYAFTEQDIKRITSERTKEAENYLQKFIGHASLDGAKARWEVLSGRAADSIADYATKNNTELIIIATHGRSGVSRWVMGSVADRVLRSACVPVLMVRAPGCIPGI
ncbi:MAG: universal stress protein [Chloroflexi bacterium]|nr:universal stress protein [Chloroflexota bacterium]